MKMFCVWQSAAGCNHGGDGWYLDAQGQMADSPVPMTLAAARQIKDEKSRCEIWDY